MSSTAEFHMPGAYHFDVPTTSGQALNAGIFRPPASPSASSSVYNLAKSTGSLYSDTNTPISGAKRKRARGDVRRESTPLADWSTNMDGAADAREDDRPNGVAAGQARYTLAGQIDTPGNGVPAAENGAMEDSIYSDVDYRRALGPKRQRDLDFGDAGAAPSPASAGWSTLAISTIGEVVGKVWEFCKTGGFRGFHAGGGTGYGLDGKATAAEPSGEGTRWCNEHDIPTLQTDDTIHTPVPGNFPQSDYMPYIADCHEMTTPETTPAPSAKRRHLNEPSQPSEANDELRRNWVLVNESSPRMSDPVKKKGQPSLSTNRASLARPTPSRSQQPRYSAPTTSSSGRRISVPVSRLGGGAPVSTTPTRNPAGRRTSLRISHAGSPSLNSRSTASFAQPRSPTVGRASTPTMGNTPTSSRIPVLSHPSGLGPNPFAASVAGGGGGGASRPSSRLSSPTARATPSHRRSRSSVSASAAAAAPPAGDAEGCVDASPRLDAEAKHLAQKKLAAERDADVRMEAFNKRLMAMIRQGKEALGTTVEVEMDMDGAGGWEDDDA